MFKSAGLVLSPIDGRTVRLHRPANYREVIKDKEIIELYSENGEIEINVGSSIIYNNSKHKVNVINRGIVDNKLVCYDLRSALLNNSSIFALPLLGGSRETMLWNSLFVNAFISTEEYDECIAILYRYSGDKIFTKFEEDLCSNLHFVKSEDIDHYHVLFIFNVPNAAKDAYSKFRSGKYSEIDDIWKLLILEFHGFESAGKTGQILYKSSKLKAEIEAKLDIDLGDSELHSIPNMKYERFNKDYYAII